MDALSKEIWENDKVDLDLIQSTVSGLREKLGDKESKAKMIISEHGAGYRLLLPSRSVY